MVLVGALVGYCRAAEPAAFAPLEAEEPIIVIEGYAECGVVAEC